MRREVIVALTKAGVGSIAGLALMMVSGKIIALIAGPVGIGLLSLLRQIRQTSYSLSTISGQTALVQGAARRRHEERIRYLATVLIIFTAATMTAVGVLIVGAPWVANWVIGDRSPSTVTLVRWVAVPVALGSFQFYTNGVLMARRTMGRLALVQVGSGLALLGMSYPVAVAVHEGRREALVALMTVYAGSGLLLSLLLSWRVGWIGLTVQALRRSYANWASARYFFSIAGTMVVTAFAGTAALLVVRALVASSGGLEAAGILDAAWTIAVSSPVLLLAAFQGYYLPLLTHRTDNQFRVNAIRRFLELATIAAAPAVTAAVTMKPLGINLLYSSAFEGALPILRWMLLGLYFRVTAWVLTVPILANADMKALLRLEIGWNLALLIITVVVTSISASIEGIGAGYAVVWVLGSLYGALYVHARHRQPFSRGLLGAWAVGFLLVLGSSLDTWVDVRVDWSRALVWCALALVFSWWVARSRKSRDMVEDVMSPAAKSQTGS
jgi:PST family polysaccharide transporter